MKRGVAIHGQENLERSTDAVDVIQWSNEFVVWKNSPVKNQKSTWNIRLQIMGIYRTPDLNLDDELDIISLLFIDIKTEKISFWVTLMLTI